MQVTERKKFRSLQRAFHSFARNPDKFDYYKFYTWTLSLNFNFSLNSSLLIFLIILLLTNIDFLLRHKREIDRLVSKELNTNQVKML